MAPSSRAGQKSVADILFRKIAADEHDLRLALLVRLPLALRIAVEHHVHALEDEALRIALHRHDALAAQDVRALLLGETIDPGHELGRIDVALEPHRHRLHVLVMIVLETAMMMIVVTMVMVMVVVVVMIMVVVVGDQEIGFDVEDAVEIEGATLEHVGDARRRISSPGAATHRG